MLLRRKLYLNTDMYSLSLGDICAISREREKKRTEFPFTTLKY